MTSRTSQRFDKILSVEKTAHGINANVAEGRMSVELYTEAIVRVTMTRAGEFDDYPFAVIAEPSKVDFALNDQPGFVEIRTSRLSVKILKDPLTFSFANKAGVILNEEDPGLGTSWIGEQVTSYRRMQEDERFIGLGEKTGPLDRRGAGYQNWNTDTFNYSLIEDPLYCSTPFYIGIHHGVQYGIFLDNSHKTFFNFGASNNRFSSFYADAGDMNYYFIAGDSVAEILGSYAHLTGRMPLPPKWSLGYQQCRYSYYPDTEVRNIARTFRDKDIPADVIVLDIHYMDKYKIFTWDPANFPDPRGLIDYLKDQHFEVVLMCDPGIKIEEGYKPYEDGKSKDVFLKYPDGEFYTGQVWPGWCHFPDYTKPKARDWWKEQLKQYSDLGVEGYWNDMNEIATWGHMLPENVEFDHDGDKATSRKARNLYGLMMARSTYEATKALLAKRPFNLTRSGFSGIQRYAAVWTGDNVSYDEHMMLGVRMVTSMGLTGIPFAGYDVGGFVGEPSTKLFARWLSIGAFSPFFRGHTMVNSRDAEPWAFGEEVENISRNFIRFRYQLMPYLYSVFYEASQTGMPVQRSLAITDTHEPRVYQPTFQHQYYFGPAFLVCPVESTKEFVKVFLPAGSWYSLYDGSRLEGNQEVIVESPIHKLPVFVKAGSLIPMQTPVMHTREKVTELIIHAYTGQTDSQFDFYEDDGVSFEFEKGVNSLRRLSYNGTTNKVMVGAAEGVFQSPLKTLKLVLHGTQGIKHIMANGKKVSASSAINVFFLRLEKYDPITEPDSMGEEPVVEATVPLTRDAIEITW
jgi:alpha-glucosidase